MNELQYDSTTRPVVNNLYGLIYNSVLQVWDGSAFVAQSSTTAGACCISMSLLSGSTVLYAANKPSGVGPGSYTVYYVDAASVAFEPQVGVQYLSIAATPPAPTSTAAFGLPAVANINYTQVAKGGNSTFTLPLVYTSPVGMKERKESNGVYKQEKTSYKIDPALWTAGALSNTQPKSRDFLVVGGNTWFVCTEVGEPCPLNGLWRLSCDRLIFQLDLDDQVHFVQASCSGADTDGSRTVTDTISGTSIQCAIEPREQIIMEAFGTKTDPEIFDIYLTPDQTYIPDDSPSLLNVGAMLKDQNAVYYEITTMEKRMRLDELLHVVAVKKL